MPLAAALLAAASSANAGISIPAGDWTLDIGGVVNAYYTSTKTDGAKSVNNITTGLLPNYLSVSGKTRQNDLDVGFTISIQPGAATDHALHATGQQENRQAFLTFGDASWGSFKLGKDLGIFASDAILNDMTLLGVGAGASGVGTTTLGRIGRGYMYADWKSQVAYSTPNFNGFSATVGVTQAWEALSAIGVAQKTDGLRGGSEPAFEGKASYDFATDAAKGHVWVSGISQKVANASTTAGAAVAQRANAYDLGATVTASGFALTGYYYSGEGIGQTLQLLSGFTAAGVKRDSEGGYVQVTYVLPTATKIGLSWGTSNLDTTSSVKSENEMWTVGAYHPLTKHLNLVAEYSDATDKLTNVADKSSKTVSLGAILFF